MNAERLSELERRAAEHAALADVTRLQIVDILTVSDASSSELSAALDVPSNLLAHHLKTLERAGLIARHPSEGDGRRTYLRLTPEAARRAGPGLGLVDAPVRRLLFVCTANSARSHLAAALWTRASDIPAASAGTHPADRVDPRAIDAARRHDIALLPNAQPRTLTDVAEDGDLIVTVCDLAHEELDHDRSGHAPRVTPLHAAMHWSIPDPVRHGTPKAFDTALELLSHRVAALAPRFDSAS